MNTYLLNKGWEYVESGLQNPLLVNLLQGWKKTDLPHDYALEKGRDKNSTAGLDEGFFQGAGLYYKKTFHLKDAARGKRIWLEFEGVFGVTEVWVNKQFAAKHTNPYTSFWTEITALVHPGDNEVMLHADSRMKPNSRWYMGTGLCRDVKLHIGEQASAAPHSLRCAAKELTDARAVLNVSARFTAPVESVTYALLDADGVIVAESRDGTLTVKKPRAWSVDDPYLYTLRATVCVNGQEDVTEEKIGIRTIEVDSKRGFRLNGKPLKLRGGCIHHDLGLLGAADHLAAERRRIRILKENGFNAVRLAHNPYGPAIFQACDELGMLCVEEAFDEWVLGRTSFGLHLTFEDRWERDLEDMIGRDFNHPSIIMWSTGNEVEERDGSADGFAWSKWLAEKVKALDPTRPVSAAACALFSEYGQRAADGTTGNQALNMAYDGFAEGRDLWGSGTKGYFAPLDVAGYNYKSVRYAYDREKFPERVIYGSESYPRDVYQTWKNTAGNDNVIGDFVWTAWDYLGEVGVGRWEVSDASRPGDPAWPWMTAACSDFDLIGQKRPQSYYRDVVWGISNGPKLFCLPPELTGKNIARLSWGWLPVERNYTYPGFEGQEMELHIYARADEVELLQNGVSLGRKPCGENEQWQTVFTVTYVPETVEVIAYASSREIGRDMLSTAGSLAKLRLTAENTVCADGRDLCFVTIQAEDEARCPVNTSEEITVTVQGADLLALGNADPKPDCAFPFTRSVCKLYQGKALAVVRTAAGAKGCMVTAKAADCVGTLPIGFVPSDTVENPYVSEPVLCAALELPLGVLIENEAAMAVLKSVLGPILDHPMLSAMKGMPLGRLLEMGGQSLPPQLLAALDNAIG